MEEIFEKYQNDLSKIKSTIQIFQLTEEFARETPDENIDLENNFIKKASNVSSKFRENRNGNIALPGILMLYVAGRFEHFVRMIFEETSTLVADNFESFRTLPKKLQDNLIKDTSKVIQDPRKYRHGEGARDAFIKNLHNNIHLNDLTVINYQCISITEQNMKSSTLEELFSKINYKLIWKDICSQMNIRGLFIGADEEKTRKECKDRLDKFMELRNNVAHPSDSITWISTSEGIDYIEFFIELGRAINMVCPVYARNTRP